VRTLACLLLAAGLAAAASEPVHLIVLHTNDLHGQLRPLPPSRSRKLLRGGAVGGSAYLATMVREARAKAVRSGAALLLIDAGDLFQGTPIGNESHGDAVIDLMNELHYDAVELGNHEFDFGVKNLLRLVERANFPVLAANAAGVKGPLRGVLPYVVIGPPKLPLRVAVIGVITPQTPQMTTPNLVDQVRFSDPAPAINALRKEVSADFYIVLSHLGVRDDLELARRVKGIDLIVGGHSHTPMQKVVNSILVVQAAAHGMALGRVDFELDPEGWKLISRRARLLTVDPAKTRPDLAVSAIIAKYAAGLDAAMQRVIGRLTAPATRKRGYASSPAGNWMADVIRRVGKARIGIMNKGGIRTDLDAGPITAGDIYRLMPFTNTVVSMDLTGAQVRALLVRSFEQGPPLEWSGLTARARRQEKGYALESVRIGSKPIEESAIYRVATNSFLARGGDGFDLFEQGTRALDTGILLREALAADLEARSPLTPPSDRRLQVLLPARQGR